jgi:hypothetical protein
VSAAGVFEVGDMPNEDLIRAERVSVRTAARRAGHPLAIRGLHKVAEHTSTLIARPAAGECHSTRRPSTIPALGAVGVIHP